MKFAIACIVWNCISFGIWLGLLLSGEYSPVLCAAWLIGTSSAAAVMLWDLRIEVAKYKAVIG